VELREEGVEPKEEVDDGIVDVDGVDDGADDGVDDVDEALVTVGPVKVE